MSKSSDLYNKRSKYYAFKENITNVASQIKSVIDELEYPIKNISESFIVDEESGDKSKLKDIQNQLKDKHSLLTSQTIPAIEVKINTLTRDYESALREEEEERQRAERAREEAREAARARSKNNGKN